MEDQIIELYKQNISNKEIAKKFNIHRTTVQRILKRNNILLRKQYETSRKLNIINFDGNIKSNNDAYVLGLIWSDGNLTRNCIEISLQEDDKQILSDISNYIYGYEHIFFKVTKTKNQYRFFLTSKDIVQKLKKIGLNERKSLICRFPKIKSKYYSHFIRGVFDGDGCIFVSKKYKGTNRVTIVSNPLFCNDLKLEIERFLNINVKINNKTDNVKCISITGNKQIEVFMNWIYDSSDLKLNRKYLKYKEEYK